MRADYLTADHAWMRKHNVALVLDAIREAGQPLSRAGLAQQIGLNKGTVSTLVQQLIDWGFISEVGLSDNHPGRPGVLLDINPNAGRIIAVDVAVDRIACVMTDFQARVIWRHREAFPPREPLADSLERIAQVIQTGIARSAAEGCRVLGIGVGAPGLTDRASGTLLYAPSVLGWRNVPIRSFLEDRFRLPVLVDNEANLAAVGEQYLGVARGVRNVIYVSANIGLGGGIIIDGKLFGGRDGYAGEIGHITVEPNGQLCPCGNHGCWATVVGPVAIVDRVKLLIANGGKTKATDMVNGDIDTLTMDHILDLASQGDGLVLRALADIGRYLGIGIASLVNTFNPDLIVLGGLLSQVGPYLLPSAEQELQQRALGALAAGLPVKLSAFTFDGSVMGCVAAVIQQVMDDPAEWRPQPSVPAGNRAGVSADPAVLLRT